MYCPFKKITTYYTKYGTKVDRQEDAAQVETSFGECDKHNCACFHSGRCCVYGKP